METWMQIAAFNPFLLKAIISLAIDILDVKRAIIFSTWTKHLFINISCKLKETACYTVVVPQWHVTNVWIQTGHPY